MPKIPYALLGLVFVTALASIVRLFGVGERCLWLDEVLAWKATQFEMGEMARRLTNPSEAENPILFFVLLNRWTAAFGDDEFILRLPAALAGILCVPAAFLLVRELVGACAGPGGNGKDRAGLLAATLVAFSDLHIQEARQARMYSLATLLLLLSSWMFLRALRPGAPAGRWIWYSILTVAFLYTHNLAIFSVPAHVLYGAVYLTVERFRAPCAASRADVTRRLRCFVLAATGIAAAFLPGANVLLERSFTSTQANVWMGPWSVRQAAREMDAAILSSPLAKRFDSAGLDLVVVLAAGSILALAVRRAKWAGLFLALGVAVPLSAITAYSIRSGTSLFLPRYLTFAQVAWLASVAVVLQTYPRLVGIPAAILIICLLTTSAELPFDQSAKPGMRAAADYIRARRTAGEPVVTQVSWTQVKLSYYMRGDAAPRQVALIPSRHLHGAMYLKDTEVVRLDVLFEDELPGFWFVCSSSYGESERLGLPLPGRWKIIETARFTQDYFWENDILIERYGRE